MSLLSTAFKKKYLFFHCGCIFTMFTFKINNNKKNYYDYCYYLNFFKYT